MKQFRNRSIYIKVHNMFLEVEEIEVEDLNYSDIGIRKVIYLFNPSHNKE